MVHSGWFQSSITQYPQFSSLELSHMLSTILSNIEWFVFLSESAWNITKKKICTDHEHKWKPRYDVSSITVIIVKGV